MTDVKIYTITSDDLSPPITGEGFCTDMVRHSDYAALEARFNQLAAEASATQHFLRNGPVINKNGQLLAAHQFASATPATDAWQREQMAKGVDAFGQYHNFSEKLFIQKEAQKFAAKLRKGEAV